MSKRVRPRAHNWKSYEELVRELNPNAQEDKPKPISEELFQKEAEDDLPF